MVSGQRPTTDNGQQTTPKLWVTDFGLARIESDVTLTMTGDLLGTLRYMSPEQALAKRVTVDHRTDIYSLGVTLYEWLTLRPPYSGEDRQELLRQIAFQEPLSVRCLNHAVPVDLETIVLKAMAKNPDDRYPATPDLADDLRRFVHNTPIKARPISQWRRFYRWTNRNPAISLLVSLAMVLSLLLAAGTLFAYARVSNLLTLEGESRRQVVGERDAALDNLYLAHIRLAQRDWESGQLTRFQRLMEEMVPKYGERDRRDWEWYYLNSLSYTSEKSTANLHRGVYMIAWSPNGLRIACVSGGFLHIWDASQGYQRRSSE